jgi:AmiR/NasT family two-component response regulator
VGNYGWASLESANESATVEELTAQNAHLRAALENRDVIGQAKGIVRLLLRIDAREAFLLLSKLSQDTNRKLADVAAVIADCAGRNEPLPPDLRASWHARTHSPTLS